MECKWDKLEREEVVDVFRKGKFELLAPNETKLKRNGGVSLWGEWYHCGCSRD